MGPMTGGGRGFCSPYSPMNAGFAGPGYPPMYAGAMMPGYGGWGTPYSASGAPYAGLYGGSGAYPYQPFGMGMGMGWGMGRGFGMGMGRGFGMGMGRGFGMGMGRGMGRGFGGGGRGRW